MDIPGLGGLIAAFPVVGLMGWLIIQQRRDLKDKDVLISALRVESKSYAERMLELSTSTRIFLELNEATLSEFNKTRKQCEQLYKKGVTNEQVSNA